jgi:histidyl-tRNA synthetase
MCVGGVELLEQLMADQALMANPNAKQGLDNMGLLFKLLRAYKALDRVSDLLIACRLRRADYL